MAACRCTVCVTLRTKPIDPSATSSMFHTDKQEYKASGGYISDSVIQEANHLLNDFCRRVSTYPLDPVLLEKYCRNHHTFVEFMAGKWSEFSVYSLLEEMAKKATDSNVNGMNLCPEHYIVGRNEVEREKNFKASLKLWCRWYADRFTPMAKERLNWSAMFNKVGKQWTTKEGKFPKRFGKYLSDTKNTAGVVVKMSVQQMETLANVLSSGVTKDGAHILSFDQGYTHGAAKDYCHKDSCWWGTYGNSRKMLLNVGGYAVRKWDNDTPVARCWAVPHENGCIIFNSYGKLQLQEFAIILHSKMGGAFKDVHLSCKTPNDTMYVNSGQGIYIGPDEVGSEIAITADADVDLKVWRRAEHSCSVCAETTTEGVGICSLCVAAGSLQAEPEAVVAPVTLVTHTVGGPVPWSFASGERIGVGQYSFLHHGTAGDRSRWIQMPATIGDQT